MKAVAYARVSTDAQAEKNTIESQLMAIREWAALRDIELVGEYTDEGVSGAIPLADREAAARLMEAVSTFDLIIIYCADRIGRDALEGVKAYRQLQRLAKVEFVSQSFDDTPTGRFTFTVMMGVAELERETIRDRTHAGIVRRVKAGSLYKTGAAPYGYSYSKTTKQLTVDETTARTVRRIYKLYAEGNGVYRIAAILTREGAPSPGTVSTKAYTNRSEGAWLQTAVRSILRSPTYKGEARYGKTQTPMPCPRIVTEQTWQTAQRLMNSRSGAVGPAQRTYILQGLVHCALCGNKMSAYTSAHGYAKYRCNRRAANQVIDSVRQLHEGYSWDIHAGELEEPVKTEARRIMADPLVLAAHIEERASAVSLEYEARMGEVDHATERQTDLAAQEARVLDGWKKGFYTETQMRDELEALRKEQKRMTRSRRDAERDVNDIRDIEAQLAEFSGTLADLFTDDELDIETTDAGSTWREPRNDDEWRTFTRALFDRIDVRCEVGSKPVLTYSGAVYPAASDVSVVDHCSRLDHANTPLRFKYTRSR